MKTDYHRRLRPVIRHLEQHYAEPIDLHEMARLAAFSPHHFHRIFKAVTGETPPAYLRRLRLEAVARQLFYDDNAHITALALEYGFSSSQALAKAFRQHFGVPPSEIRACTDLESIIRTMHNSKIGHLLHKSGHVNASTNPHHEASSTQQESPMKTERLAPCTIAYIRVTGPYGQGCKNGRQTLSQWAGAHGLPVGECLSLYLDNPETTPAEKCRTDIAITLPDEVADSVPVEGNIEKRQLPGGSYATLRRTVTAPEQYRQYWQEAIAAIIAARLEIDDTRPSFAHYHRYDAATGEADVSFCTAIRV
ncbi:MAG: AraC family transcriptional regulator [Brachymonas sp.]|nr:AraC family transcriptional regulator [Brachymonas sp.]